MQTRANGSPRHTAVLRTMMLLALFLLTSCDALFSWFHTGDEVDLAPFQQMAAAASCADIRNRLFLIDDQLVFSEQAGNCADGAYAQTLYGSTPDQVLCEAYDSEAGPMMNCPDEHYRALFDTMTSNLDQPDLELGAEHTVQPVPF